ncbi:MAG: ArsR/SmtB family transcription factor [Acidobacteriota bacterium]
MIEETASIFKALGEPTRLKIVKLLSIKELCVCELEAVLDMSQPRVSQHLKVLRNAGIIRERKDKQKSFFSLDSSILENGAIKPFLSFMAEPMGGMEYLQNENARLQELDSNENVNNCKAGTCAESKAQAL